MSDVRSRVGEGKITHTNTDTQENPDHRPEIAPKKMFSQPNLPNAVSWKGL